MLLPPLLLWALLAAAPATAAEQAPLPGDPLGGSGEVARTLLTASQLHAADLPAPVDNSAFALPEGAAPPRHVMSGTLQMFGGSGAPWTVHHDTFFRASEPPIVSALRRIPRIDVELVQSGSHLVPTWQALRYTRDAYWNVIVGPGRIWSETGDNGASRASLPVTLVERNQNCAYHGVVAFLFDGAATSPFAFQVTQETCKYFKFDLWDTGPTRFSAGRPATADAALDAWAAETAARLPVRPLAQIRDDHPRAQVYPQAFAAGFDREHLTAHGVAFGGVHYQGPVHTRHGDYPYPEQVRLPSYSTSKTAAVAVALMRLAQRDGVEVAELELRDHVPKPPKDRFLGVTFAHALDMATGHYFDPDNQEDEKDSTAELNFFVPEHRNRKLRGALAYPTMEPPGERWVYHTTDSFLLSVAMSTYLGRQQGNGKDPADLLEFLAAEVWRPLGVSAGALQSVRTDNRADGLVLGGYGMFWTPDDIVKIANLLNGQRGRIGERQVLHPGMLAAAMQEDENDPGLEAIHNGHPNRYKSSVWSRQIQVSEGASGTNSIWVQQMLGYGGIGVLMLPNDAVFYYFGDRDQHDWLRAAREAYKLR